MTVQRLASRPQAVRCKNSAAELDATKCSERFFGPLVLLHDLLFFFGRKVVLNIKELANFWDALVLDQTSDLGAGQLEQRFDVQVVAGHDKLEENLLVEVNEVRMPWVDD